MRTHIGNARFDSVRVGQAILIPLATLFLLNSGCVTASTAPTKDDAYQVFRTLGEEPVILVGHANFPAAFKLPGNRDPEIPFTCYGKGCLLGNGRASYNQSLEIEGRHFQKKMSIQDPALQIQKVLVGTLKKQLGLGNLHEIINPMMIDYEDPNSIRSQPLVLMLETLLWGFETLPGEYRNTGRWEALDTNRLQVYYRFQTRLTLLNRQGHPVFFREQCSFSTLSEGSMKKEDYLRDDGLLLRQAVNRGASVCADQLIGKFMEMTRQADITGNENSAAH